MYINYCFPHQETKHFQIYDSNRMLVREFVCKYDCIRTLKMSDKTLQKAIDNSSLYNGFYFKMLGERLVL